MGWWQWWKARVKELRREVAAVYLAVRDPRCPWYARLVALLVVAYAFGSIDLIPDFIPVLGLLDDLVLVPLGVLLVRRMVRADVMDDCRARAEAAIAYDKPVFWSAAVVIVVLWGALPTSPTAHCWAGRFRGVPNPLPHQTRRVCNAVTLSPLAAPAPGWPASAAVEQAAPDIPWQ